MKGYLFSLLFLLLLAGCNTNKALQKNTPLPADPHATAETKALYTNLHSLLGKGILFGHQDDLAYGVNWQYESGRSDVKDVTGEYPALYGWELGNLELGHAKSLDSVPFDAMKKFIRQGYDNAGVITISWHLNNPFNGKSAWDTTHGSVAAILPGGTKHELYKTYLDKLADFFSNLKGNRGEAIPVLFRPFHEHTGNWFWWGQSACTAQEYIALWKFTIDYLRHNKKIHNLLYVYNTAGFSSENDFLGRYPGDDYVDVVSFDAYQYQEAKPGNENSFVTDTDKKLALLNEIAASHKKIPAFAETGFEAIPKNDWWTKDLLPLLQKHRPSFVLVWRNAGLMKASGKMHYYTPYAGQASAADFIQFFKNDKMMFENKTRNENIYGLK